VVVPLALVPAPVAPQGDSAIVQVVRVIDGDTFQVHSCGGKHAHSTLIARSIRPGNNPSTPPQGGPSESPFAAVGPGKSED
jgi:endonuclease YncB( thermonuclease family)